MRRSTVRTGLDLIIAAVVLIIIATFYHEQIALLISLSPDSENRLIFLCLFLGGITGCTGITVAVFGLLRSSGGPAGVNLVKPLVIIALLVLMFFFLLFSSFNRPENPRLHPGETITI
jgi:H+/Cl- antiporter ClcA